MYRKYYLVEVVLLLLLSHSGWNGPSVTLLSCTSESSKLVRDVVQKRFLSVVDRYRVSLPLECPLHPRRDMFWWLQTELEATKVAGEETWHCPVCGQKFRCENTFVTHWDASHSRTLGMAEETVCLDDYCDVFRCDVLRKRVFRQRQEEEEEIRKGSDGRHQYHTGFRGLSLYAQQRPQLEDEETKEKKRNCDPQVMGRIQHKCRSLIRQCTIGMMANLSSKDFQDIEDDLDQTVCSFLTCDKYWDDFDLQMHHVPVVVMAILGLLVIGLFCFCYYGLWILLEKYPVNTNQICCNCQRASPTAIHYRQKLLRRKIRHNSPEFHSRHLTPEYSLLENAPEAVATEQNSPEHYAGQNNSRHTKQYPAEYISRQNSPEYSSRQNASEYNSSRQNSPEYTSRKNSPEYISRQNSPEYASRQNSPEFVSRQNSPEYISRQNSPEYNISRQNSPRYTLKENSLLDCAPSHKEYYYVQNPPENMYLKAPSNLDCKQNKVKIRELYPDYYPKEKTVELNANPCEISKYIQSDSELRKTQNRGTS